MLHLPKQNADLENTRTWAKYSSKLCGHCVASCCSLPVEVKTEDLVRMQLIEEFSLQEDPKYIARRLIKERLVDHFHARTATFTLARRANGDCIYLDCSTRRCIIYFSRPDTCRNHPGIGPRSGYCAFKKKPHNAIP
ncbi:MAG: YkgJ family cysteine cluster protein [Proteobacteria bacterium]|nr:YkgJ family cysteine cluster protein [Pseudomonadota bacterium]